jgi:DNA-binding PadR family transcriptional regulator
LCRTPNFYSFNFVRFLSSPRLVTLGGFDLNLDLQPTIPNRTLRAFLDLAVLCQLSHRPMTCYEINKSFIEKFGIMIAPSTIYSTLSSMESNGEVKCARNRHVKVYSLTEKGRKVTENMNSIIEEIHRFLTMLLGVEC